MLHKTFMAFVTAAALGCVPVATSALAAGHPAGHASAGRAAGGHPARGRAIAGPVRSRHVARSGRGYGYGPAYNASIYDNCSGYGYDPAYGYNGCPGYGVPVVGRVINGILNGYAPY
ncbi:MAG: hypothetical protein WB760_27315 [Xanthobacteraceae bacterium]